MFSYTAVQWLFFFYFYSFFGWCFESAVVSASKRRLVNRGFMRGPFLPLYGSGAVMMLLVSMPFRENLVMVYIAGCIGATALEYVTGVAMEALFKVRYWDYSNRKFNFQGHICLKTTLAWGFLTILMTEAVHKPVERLVLSVPDGVLTAATLALTAGIFADFALSFKAALDLRDILAGMERAREELVRVQRRLDAIIAAANEEIENMKQDLANRRDELTAEWNGRREAFAGELAQRGEELSETIGSRVEDLKKSIEDRLERIKHLSQKGISGYLESRQEEIGQLRIKYHKNSADRDRLSHIRDFFQKDLLRSNPTMSSSRFKEALEELKKLTERKKKD